MNKRNELIDKAMSDLLNMPKDVVLDLPRITVIGRNEVRIENHRGIIEYDLTRIRVSLSRGFLQIEGENLEIMVMMPEEIRLEGTVTNLEFLD